MPGFERSRVPPPQVIHPPPRMGGPPPGPARQERGNEFLRGQVPGQTRGAGLDQGISTQGATTAEDAIPAQYAGKSEVWKMGYADGLAQGRAGMHRISSDSRTSGAITKASTATGVSEDNLTAMAIIESTGNRSVGTNSYGYTGLMQMGREAASDVGMRYRDLVGAENVEKNALAGAKYWNFNDKVLDEGVPRDPLHMYLAHQQGGAGTNKLMKTLAETPDALATGVQKANLPEAVRKARGRQLTQQDFYDYWAGKMQAIQDVMAESKAQGG